MFFLCNKSMANLPNVIYGEDVENYQSIFELQEKGKFKDADKLIKEINNDILMGYVLYQRYMSPYYKTPFKEVKEWLFKYYDMPEANDIYKLGLKKGARKELKKPKREARRTQYFNDSFKNSYQMIQNSYSYLPTKDRKEVNYMIKIFNARLKKGYTKNARQILENPLSKKFFKKNDYLRMQAYLAFSYFLANQDDMAILWAREPAEKLNFYLANWALGLVYWRQGDYVKSRDAFKNVAFTKRIPQDIVAAGAYWAFRANERIEDVEQKDDFEIFLDTAASYPKTFYGILAATKLNKTLEIQWEEPSLTLENSREITSWEGGMRALALIQLGMKNEAMEELKFLINTANDDFSSNLINAVLAVAEVSNMPYLSINMSNYIKEYSDDSTFASCTYPVIDIDLEDGWSVDKALVNAVIRQESRFNPKAKSNAGARGLMQIMPSTASFITRDSSLRKKKSKLFEEELNLSVGQMYIEYLLTSPNINGNLFKFLLAYNAGPGNLRKQEERIINPGNDPLFFIESINIKESRIYIERVMANFWIYRNKLGQQSEALEELSNDLWPTYISKGDIQNSDYSDIEIEYLEDIFDEKQRQLEEEFEEEGETIDDGGIVLEKDEKTSDTEKTTPKKEPVTVIIKIAELPQDE